MTTQGICRRIAALAILAAGLCRAEMREWTSASGTKVEAEFVRLVGESVTLRRANGEMLLIRRNLLSAEDQALVAKLATPEIQTINLSGLSSRPSLNTSIVLPKAEADALQTAWTDPKGGDQLSFYARFRVNPNSPKNKDWEEGHPVEFQIHADCMRVKDNKRQRENTDCHMYLLGEKGQPAAVQSKPINSMCPT
jgi:hypothetical protein